jgi:hypothetical protein
MTGTIQVICASLGGRSFGRLRGHITFLCMFGEASRSGRRQQGEITFEPDPWMGSIG